MDMQKGAMLAAVVAGLLIAGGCDSSDKGDSPEGTSASLKCEGGNECAGHSECASPEGKNECQGMNECKGMGWVTVDTAEECKELGGTVIESKG